MALILIIDDDGQIREMLKKTLEREGYDVITAVDGIEGIRTYLENSVDLIITDIVMPRKEGLEIIQYFQSHYPEAKIIAISGGGRLEPENYLCLAERFGAWRTLSKPIERAELLKIVQEALA